MADNTLLNYLRTVLNLEIQCRTLSSSMERNRKQVASYSSYNNQEKPSPPLAPVPDTGAEIFMFVVGALCIFMIIGGIRLIISGYELLAVPVIVLIIFGCLFAYIISAGISDNRENKKWCSEQKQQYEELISNIERQKEAIRQALPILNNDYEILERQYQETRSLLAKYYDLNIIYPKYRGIVPIAMFVQYLESGIVYRLQGPDGAYSRYEDELFRQLIINKLDIIISRLDEIRATQYELANALERSNQQISELSNRADIANQHLAVQSYNSIQTNEAVKALKDYTIFRDLLR